MKMPPTVCGGQGRNFENPSPRHRKWTSDMKLPAKSPRSKRRQDVCDIHPHRIHWTSPLAITAEQSADLLNISVRHWHSLASSGKTPAATPCILTNDLALLARHASVISYTMPRPYARLSKSRQRLQPWKSRPTELHCTGLHRGATG